MMDESNSGSKATENRHSTAPPRMTIAAYLLSGVGLGTLGLCAGRVLSAWNGAVVSLAFIAVGLSVGLLLAGCGFLMLVVASNPFDDPTGERFNDPQSRVWLDDEERRVNRDREDATAGRSASASESCDPLEIPAAPHFSSVGRHQSARS